MLNSVSGASTDKTWNLCFPFSFGSLGSNGWRVTRIVTAPFGSMTPVVGLTQYRLGAVVFTLKQTFFSALLVNFITTETGSLKGPKIKGIMMLMTSNSQTTNATLIRKCWVVLDWSGTEGHEQDWKLVHFRNQQLIRYLFKSYWEKWIGRRDWRWWINDTLGMLKVAFKVHH